MRKPNPSLKVIWAVDPAKQAERFKETLRQTVRYLLAIPNAEIQPVSVLKMTPELSAYSNARWRRNYLSAAEEMLEQVIRELRVPNVAPPHLIIHDSLSTRGAVEALSAYAQRSGAQLIIAQTHSRKGMSRLILGSFAETLLFRSRVPVMLMGKEFKQFKGFENILFPTDFANRARAQLNRVLDLARLFGAKVTLFHCVRYPIEPFAAGFDPLGPLGPFSAYIEQEIEWAHQKANSWMKTARDQGVHMEYVIDPKGSSVWESILRAAEKSECGLIAMHAQSGPVSSTMLGSVTRQVVRNARCPVLVLKPRMARSLKAAPSRTERDIPRAA